MAEAKPKKVPYTTLFRKWDSILLTILFALLFFWSFFFVPDSVIQWVASRVGVAKTTGGSIFSLVTSTIIAVTFGRFLIGDPLLDQNWKSSRFLKGEFPSLKLAGSLKIDQSNATRVFLSYYDCWQFTNDPNYEAYRETTRVHYRCLFVVLAKPLLLVLTASSIVLIIIGARQDATSAAIVGQAIVAGFMLLMVVILHLFNRLPSERRKEPTGCWAAWRRKCDENYQELIGALGNEAPDKFVERMRARHDKLLALTQ